MSNRRSSSTRAARASRSTAKSTNVGKPTRRARSRAASSDAAPTSATDTDLTLRAAAGDRDAFDALWERHQSALAAAARALLGTRTPLGVGPEDIVQDTAEAAWRLIDRYTPGTSFMAWLVAILRHRFLRVLDLKDIVHGVKSGVPVDEAAAPRGAGNAASPSRRARWGEAAESLGRAIGTAWARPLDSKRARVASAPTESTELIRIPVDLHASDPLPTAASHGGIELGGARELTGTRITLTDRDRVVLRLFSDDVPAKVIAEEAGLSPRQVYGHLQRLCDTLDDRLGGFARHSIPGFTSAAPDVPESRVARIAAARARREAEAKPKRARKTLATKGGTSGPKAHVAPKPAKKAKSKGRAKGRAKGPAKK